MELNPYSFVSLAAFLIDAGLALYAFTGKAGNRARRLFALVLALFAIASFADFLVRNSYAAGEVALLYRLIFAALAMAAFIIPDFTLSFLGRRLPAASYLLPLALAMAVVSTDLFIGNGFTTTVYGPELVFGRFAFVLFLYLLVGALYSFRLLFAISVSLRRPPMRRKFVWLLAGLGAIMVPAVLASFLPLFGWAAPPLFPACSAIGSACITYSFIARRGHNGR